MTLTKEQIAACRNLGAAYVEHMPDGEALFTALCDMAEAHRRSLEAVPSATAPTGTPFDPEFEQEGTETPGTWQERCAALYQVIGALSTQMGVFETSQDVCDALDVACGRGDVGKLLPWPKDAGHGCGYAHMEERRIAEDWNELFQSATMGHDPEIKRLASIPDLWPNKWHQDCAMVAFLIHGMREQMKWLAELLKACPFAELTYNDDPDEGPIGYTLDVNSCSSIEVSAPTLEGLIHLAMTTEPDEDGNVFAGRLK